MLILVTGGSGSGKSEFAEYLVTKLQERPRLYIATMYPFDEESRRRVARHQSMRSGKGFETLECYTGLDRQDVSGYGTVLLECMSNLTANELYQEGGSGDACAETILEGVRRIRGQCRHLVIVTNEIFSDGIRYDPETMRYQRFLGAINRELARMSDVTAEVVYSIPLILKGKEQRIHETDMEQLSHRFCHVFQASDAAGRLG